MLAACQKEAWLDLRLFCESYNAIEDSLAGGALDPERFSFTETGEGQRWQACPIEDEGRLLTLVGLPNGRLHTASLTMHAREEKGTFLAQGKRLLGAFTAAPPDRCARWLYALGAGEGETLGFVQLEEEGFLFAYAANEAGMYLRVSRVDLLPPEESEAATLREYIYD